jgi:signal transduction histidine kinase
LGASKTGQTKHIRFGLNLRVSLIVFPLVAAMLVLALAPIRSYLRLRAALDDARRELTCLLLWCRFDVQAVRQSVEYFGVAFLDEDAHDLDELVEGGRATLDVLRKQKLAPRQEERLQDMEQAYARMAAAGRQTLELARAGELRQAKLRFSEMIEEHRDQELLPLVNSALIESRLSLGKALDSFLTASAQLARIPSMVGIEPEANRLREQAAEAISATKLARQAHRLLGAYRCFAFFEESRDKLAVTEHDLDHAYQVWEAQVAARNGDGGEAAPVEGSSGIGVEVRAMQQSIGRLAQLHPTAARGEILRIYETQLEPRADIALPRALEASFQTYDARISALLDSIAAQSRVGGIFVGAVASLALGLALVCPWLISRWIVRPVLALTRAARELGAGGGIGPVSVHAGGEIAELAASFNRMAEQLAQRTRELEAERAREKVRHAERLASVGILASGLAHQINNPVNNILLTAEHALGEEGPEAARIWREALAASAKEAKRCARIVRGLVAFSRGEPGQKWREDAHQVLRRAAELTAETAAEHGAAVELRLGREPAPILTNPIALEQALVNILRNAIQSRPEARVTLSTRCVGQTVRIEIRDDGCGLDRAALGRLFDPFYTTRASEGGIGLGLSVAHRIITNHGGEIRVDSRLGEGTAVTVDLPLDLGQEGGR